MKIDEKAKLLAYTCLSLVTASFPTNCYSGEVSHPFQQGPELVRRDPEGKLDQEVVIGKIGRHNIRHRPARDVSASFTKSYSGEVSHPFQQGPELVRRDPEGKLTQGVVIGNIGNCEIRLKPMGEKTFLFASFCNQWHYRESATEHKFTDPSATLSLENGGDHPLKVEKINKDGYNYNLIVDGRKYLLAYYPFEYHHGNGKTGGYRTDAKVGLSSGVDLPEFTREDMWKSPTKDVIGCVGDCEISILTNNRKAYLFATLDQSERILEHVATDATTGGKHNFKIEAIGKDASINEVCMTVDGTKYLLSAPNFSSNSGSRVELSRFEK